MVSFATPSNHFISSPYSFLDLSTRSFSSWVIVFSPRKPAIKKEQLGGSLLRFPEGRIGYCRDSCVWRGGFVRRCKKELDSEGDSAVEAELLEFMKNSKNPEVFPSKKVLMESGRMDLVEAIVRKGGWLALGWDLEDGSIEEEKEKEGEEGKNGFVQNEVKKGCDSLMAKGRDNGVLQEKVANGSALEINEVGRYEGSSGSASSSGRSLEAAGDDDSGIDGILSRLEKARNINFGLATREKENTHSRSDDVIHNWLDGTSEDVTVGALKRSNRGIIRGPGSKLKQNTTRSDVDDFRGLHQPDNWRTWSIQRAGFSDMEFEAEEIAFNNSGAKGASGEEILEVRAVAGENLNSLENLNSAQEAISHNQLMNRIQLMELELTSVLHSLRSNDDGLVSQKDYNRSSDNLHKLSDAWEFQETEIINARDKLRSIRAKLAVLEGKMALAIIDSQKMVDEKQRRIDKARKALTLMRTASIVWPNSASEVLLAGSFDGWSGRRKMEKLSTGVFTLTLKLYPGRYEIKFIVDGEWKVDPLRPIVRNKGFKNNLLIIT